MHLIVARDGASLRSWVFYGPLLGAIVRIEVGKSDPPSEENPRSAFLKISDNSGAGQVSADPRTT
jgi:hypothetical protein